MKSSNLLKDTIYIRLLNINWLVKDCGFWTHNCQNIRSQNAIGRYNFVLKNIGSKFYIELASTHWIWRIKFLIKTTNIIFPFLLVKLWKFTHQLHRWKDRFLQRHDKSDSRCFAIDFQRHPRSAEDAWNQSVFVQSGKTVLYECHITFYTQTLNRI